MKLEERIENDDEQSLREKLPLLLTWWFIPPGSAPDSGMGPEVEGETEVELCLLLSSLEYDCDFLSDFLLMEPFAEVVLDKIGIDFFVRNSLVDPGTIISSCNLDISACCDLWWVGVVDDCSDSDGADGTDGGKGMN